MGSGSGLMPERRAQRRAERRTKVAVLFADRTDRALDLLELLEMAWHDSFDEGTPPEDVIDDVLQLSAGSLRSLIRWSRLAVTDYSEVLAAADGLRDRG